jgi:cyanophycinase
MPGPVALVGAGEFLDSMAEFDAGLLLATGRVRPRVAILPTASYPDGEEVFQRWATMGVSHFGGLGAEVEPVLVRDRGGADDPAAAQAIGEADLIYLSGGKPAYLMSTLEGTAVGRGLAAAHARGAILAGCSAGAMVLAGHAFDFRIRLVPWPLRWRPGLGFVADASVIPHYDLWPEPMTALIALQAPRGTRVLGIDEDTAVVGRDGAWQVHGRSRVTVWHGRRRERYRAGEIFRLG